jgi:uncharacterized membrane protein YoaK (UPF0700 family)
MKARTKRLTFWDIGLIKWSSIFFGAIVGAYLAGFVKKNIIWMVVITIVLAIKPIIKFLKS